MTALLNSRLLLALAACGTRLGSHSYVLSSAAGAVIAIASGINNLSFALVLLGCESLVATLTDVAAAWRRDPESLRADAGEPELLSA